MCSLTLAIVTRLQLRCAVGKGERKRCLTSATGRVDLSFLSNLLLERCNCWKASLFWADGFWDVCWPSQTDSASGFKPIKPRIGELYIYHLPAFAGEAA